VACACIAPIIKERRRRHLQEISGLSDREQTIRLSDIDVTGAPGTAAMVAAVRALVASPGHILTIWGGYGNAKTTALQAAVNELCERDIQAVYVTLFDLVSHIRDAFDADKGIKNDSAYQRLLMWETVDVLAIDEFDKLSHQTAWTVDQVTDLIDKRYRIALDGTAGTLIAMNTDPATLPGGWISDRLFDSMNVVVANHDPSMRKEKG
jgi:DNA replication protein DnaC